jgi:hypothetical protein
MTTHQKAIALKITEHTKPENVSWFFGPHNADGRQDIMRTIHGAKLPKSKCGITALMEALYAAFPVAEWSCIAHRERLLAAEIRRALEESPHKEAPEKYENAQEVADHETAGSSFCLIG